MPFLSQALAQSPGEPQCGLTPASETGPMMKPSTCEVPYACLAPEDTLMGEGHGQRRWVPQETGAPPAAPILFPQQMLPAPIGH